MPSPQSGYGSGNSISDANNGPTRSDSYQSGSGNGNNRPSRNNSYEELSAHDDDFGSWNDEPTTGGFGSASKTIATKSEYTSSRQSSATKHQQAHNTVDDFNSLDVKLAKPKSSSINKTKKIEDDAWDLLNN